MEAVHLRWLIQPLAAALHVADVVRVRRSAAPAPSDWSGPLGIWAEPLAIFDAWAATATVEQGPLLEQAIGLAPRFERETELAASALAKVADRSQAAAQAPALARALASMRRATLAAQPDLLDRLQAESEPLRATWERVGGPLLDHIGRWTAENWLVPAADVLLVPPVGGGFGAAHPAANLARIEVGGPVADACPPPTVQVAWLVAQLNADLPVFQGSLTRTCAARAAAWAMLAITLEAAADAELFAHDDATCAAAARAWGLEPVDAVETLRRWWNVYRDARPSWPAALAALDALLGARP
ncbi:MAG: hypothetical protein K1X74_20230 [Pirellulales bacterium]|nr:hypothetical protein [Pirellulales bacterium]